VPRRRGLRPPLLAAVIRSNATLAFAAERQYRWADVRLLTNPSDDDILRLVDEWVDDLERGDYATAYARTGHDSYDGWTPDLIRDAVAGYGLPDAHGSGVIFRVTSRAAARGHQHYRAVDREHVPPKSIATVSYDLPLNGEWSDLTARFRVVPAPNGAELILEEIHVL
jgi:hypothetical protein